MSNEQEFTENKKLLELIPNHAAYDVIKSAIEANNSEIKASVYELVDNLRKITEKKEPQKESDKIQRMFNDFDNSANYTSDRVIKELDEISTGGLSTGYSKLDEHFQLLKGDSVLIEAKSSHGKTAMLKNLMIKMIESEKNIEAKPMCIYMTYESLRPILWTSLCNIEASEKLIEYSPQKKDINGNIIPDEVGKIRIGKYVISNQEKFNVAKNKLDEHFKHKNIIMPEFTYNIEDLAHVIQQYKKQYPERTQIYFIDYAQIVKHGFDDEAKGWQAMSKVSEFMRNQARDNKLIFIAGSQINDKGDTALTKSFYQDATVAIRLLNHSHPKMKEQDSTNYRERKDGHATISISLSKCRHFGTNQWLEQFVLMHGDLLEYSGVSEQLKAVERQTPKLTPLD
jgi:replicative DNA helicase